MVKLREPNKADAIQTLILVAVFIIGIAVILYLSYPDNMLAGIILVGGCLLLLVRWHSRTFGYRCANCDEDFEIPMWKDLFSFQGFNKQGSWKYLKCPNCKQRTTARELTKVR
jgi:DNA-directed RNA polymerase subunit RPC12/RpoP